jgi:hypothetical protein
LPVDVSAGPDDPGDNDDDAKNFNADAYEMNPLARSRFERGIAGNHAAVSMVLLSYGWGPA